jgi:hypothetical protein
MFIIIIPENFNKITITPYENYIFLSVLKSKVVTYYFENNKITDNFKTIHFIKNIKNSIIFQDFIKQYLSDNLIIYEDNENNEEENLMYKLKLNFETIKNYLFFQLKNNNQIVIIEPKIDCIFTVTDIKISDFAQNKTKQLI